MMHRIGGMEFDAEPLFLGAFGANLHDNFLVVHNLRENDIRFVRMTNLAFHD